MIDINIISNLNKSVLVSSNTNLSSNTSFFSNEMQSMPYDNYIFKISTNLNTVTFENLFAGYNSGDWLSSNALGFYIILACLLFAIVIIIQRVAK